MAHARFAPSAAQRVMDCPASLKLNETEPDRAGIDAAHGTAAHFLAETCQRTKSRTSKYEGCNIAVSNSGDTWIIHERHPAPAPEEGHSFEVDDEMVAAVQDYLDWCNDLDGDHYTEIRVDISPWCPEEGQFGTSDHICISRCRRVMNVDDLKYGKGVQVFARNNPQGALYALGALREFDLLEEVEEINIRICQPRLNHYDTWTVSRQELIEFGERIKERFALALADNPPFGPTEKACKFCKVSARCRALSEFMSDLTALAFDDISGEFETNDVTMLSDEELVTAWRMSGLLKARMSAIAKEMIRLMADGHEMPTVFLAEAITKRKFRSREAAADFLMLDCGLEEEQIFKKRLVSPNQAMKLLNKEQKAALAGEDLIVKPPGGPCIVDASSKRARYEGGLPLDGEDGFVNLDDEDEDEDRE